MADHLHNFAREARDKYPDPLWEPVAHTLAVYADTPDEAYVIVATSNVYGKGVTTGLTWGDLRRLAAAQVTK